MLCSRNACKPEEAPKAHLRGTWPFPECSALYLAGVCVRMALPHHFGCSAQRHLPCRGSYCRICTSSTHSAGNQPVRPFTDPSQKPPSPILSTAGGEGGGRERRDKFPSEKAMLLSDKITIKQKSKLWKDMAMPVSTSDATPTQSRPSLFQNQHHHHHHLLSSARAPHAWSPALSSWVPLDTPDHLSSTQNTTTRVSRLLRTQGTNHHHPPYLDGESIGVVF